MISRYDENAARAARLRRHERDCRDDDCTWCESEAEDRAREREAS